MRLTSLNNAIFTYFRKVDAITLHPNNCWNLDHDSEVMGPQVLTHLPIKTNQPYAICYIKNYIVFPPLLLGAKIK